MSIEAFTGAWNYAGLPANVRIGERCFIERKDSFERFRSLQNPGLTLGDRVGPRGQVTIGNYSCLVGSKIVTNASVAIGDYCFIAHDVMIADHAHAIPPTASEQFDEIVQPSAIVIEDCVWIGAAAILLTGARIGAGSIIGAASIVDFEVPPNTIVLGNPGRIVSWSAAGRS